MFQIVFVLKYVDNSAKGLHGAAIIAIVISVFVILMLILVIVFICIRRKCRGEEIEC